MKCTIEGRSIRSGRKVLIMLAGHMVVEKTNVINKTYTIIFTRVEEKRMSTDQPMSILIPLMNLMNHLHLH